MNFYKVKGFWLFRMKVTSAKPKLQLKCKGKTSFSFISTQRYRGLSYKFKNAVSLYFLFIHKRSRVTPGMREPTSNPIGFSTQRHRVTED